ncbi:helix-turn-helix transcriptional regulator [Cohnella pontilimi]|uniref:Helix-turn-helix transcriptional regulator n=1 Tax=Cohnella pontilimi TaxID=2564100 RepID=A0A4U0F9U6_9BACL|nr:helix-turn-helix transcriptional regulator [Cohnella pontilimi]TJY41543.1 helix-turn-helix transcriptional regulator [Cohnella pontilimi]
MIEKKPEIDAAIVYIHNNIYEPISLSKLSKHVGYSPYHFIRLFKAQTGLSPRYFISSLRIQKAKELLLHTHLTIRDVAQQVGHESLGTFTTRFAEKVGVTPSNFRIQETFAQSQLRSFLELPQGEILEASLGNGASVAGSLHSDIPFEGIVLIGLFHKPIPDSLPQYGMIRLSLGDFRFSNVTPGTYYLMATTVSWKMNAVDIMLPNATLRTRHHDPIFVGAGQEVSRGQVTLYPPDLNDPPILISLPLLMNQFLSRIYRT